VSALDDIIDLVRDRAGADFAFILSRRGRLVTRHAPENMPEEGRLTLVSAGETVIGTDRIALRTMPRESLVPYGGAAPVDVYVGAREAAIMCVVMATWTDQSQVEPAFELGFGELDRLIGDELAKRGRADSSKKKKGLASQIPPAPGSSSGRSSKRAPASSPGELPGKGSVPPPRAARKTIVGIDDPTVLPGLPLGKAKQPSVIPKAPGSSSGRSAGGKGRTQRPPPFTLPKTRTQRPPAAAAPPPKAGSKDWGRGTLPFIPGDTSTAQQALRALASQARATGPEITIGEARIGHATLVAIELEQAAPQISFGAAPLGRETLAAIDASEVPQGSSGSAPELRVSLASMPDIDPSELEPIDRQTLPFTEPAVDAKRAYEDAAKRRAAEPPDVRVRLASLDFETKSAVLEERSAELAEAARRARLKAQEQSKRNSNIEAWHDALNELVDDGKSAKKKQPRPK
jgi:hypothetical protein